MRITAVLLFVVLFQAVALESYAQTAKVSVKADQLELTELFTLIEKQSEFLFFYVDADVKDVRVNVNIRSKQIREVLQQALAGTDLTYTINDRNINILRNASGIAQQTRMIAGVVSDETGTPIIGANVVVKGTTLGTITDIDGNFSLEAAPNAVLQVSYIGYITREVSIGNNTRIDIQLVEDMQKLEEVVVVGYGTQKRANLTGAVSTVSLEEMGKRQVMQASLALQGLAPGVVVTQRSGKPGGDGGTISIRGKTTLGNNDALVLVDGVEMGINNIDPNLIESISVLKDAASSAIYGSRAANGVILITTKRAEADKFSVRYNGYAGWQEAMNIPDFVGAIDFMELVNIANTNIGKPLLYTPQYIEEYRQNMASNPDRYPDTKWFDECLTNNGMIQNHFVTLSGGSKRMRTLATVGYQEQNGVTENTNVKRYTFRMNTDMEISKQFTAKIDAHATYGQNSVPSRIDDAFHWMARIPTNQPGRFTNGQWGMGWNGDNPIAFTNEGGIRNTDMPSAVLNFTLQYKPTDYLTVQGQYSPNYWESHQKDFRDAIQTYTYDGSPSYVAPQKSTLNDRSERNLRNLLIGSVTFDKTFGSHGVKAMAGYQQEGFRQDWHNGYREVYIFPDYPVLNAGGEENQKATGSSTEYALQSLFGRINYDYQGKYLFEANMRYDGSSRFADGKKWGVFPSFSVGWRLSEEGFWDSLREVVDNFKIRASWGQLGNQNIGNYPFASTVTLTDIKYVFNKNIASGGALVNMANAAISWETTTQTDIGLDMTFLGKVNVVADYYYKRTNDILLQLAIPRIIGMNAPQQNAGEVENRGWDLGITYADRAGDLNYRVSFNLSDVKNKVLDLKGIDETGLTVSREGYAMGSLYGLQAIGYIQPEDYDANGDYLYATQYGSFGPGDIKYVDQNGDGVINTSDRVIMGGTIPRYTYGLTLYGEYKGFDLNIFFQGVGKANGYINGQGIQTFIEGGSVLEMHKDYWTPENRNAKFPRLAFNETNNMQNSTFWMKDASYVRLKNLQVGYTIPRKTLSKTPISNLRLYFSTDNVFTVSDFWKQYDVEAPVGNGSFYPIMRNFSFGLDLSF